MSFVVADATKADDSEGRKFRLGFVTTVNEEDFHDDLDNTIPEVELVPFQKTNHAPRKAPEADYYDDLDAILVAADTMLMDGTALGNDLAKFHDKGRCVIIAFFALHRDGIVGDWKAKNYTCTTGSGRMNTKQRLLGEHNAEHPIMKGVKTFNGTMKAVDITPHDNCDLVATWSDGTPLVVASKTTTNTNDENNQRPARHVVLNFFPVSSYVGASNFYQAKSNGGMMIRNAVTWCIAGNSNIKNDDENNDAAKEEL